MKKILILCLVVSYTLMAQSTLSSQVNKTASKVLFMQYYLNEIGVSKIKLPDNNDARKAYDNQKKKNLISVGAGGVGSALGAVLAFKGFNAFLDSYNTTGLFHPVTSVIGGVIVLAGTAVSGTGSYNSSTMGSDSDKKSIANQAANDNKQVEAIVNYVSQFLELSVSDRNALQKLVQSEINDQILNNVQEIKIDLIGLLDKSEIVSTDEVAALAKIWIDIESKGSRGKKQYTDKEIANAELIILRDLHKNIDQALHYEELSIAEKDKIKNFKNKIEEEIIMLEYLLN